MGGARTRRHHGVTQQASSMRQLFFADFQKNLTQPRHGELNAHH